MVLVAAVKDENNRQWMKTVLWVANLTTTTFRLLARTLSRTRVQKAPMTRVIMCQEGHTVLPVLEA